MSAGGRFECSAQWVSTQVAAFIAAAAAAASRAIRSNDGFCLKLVSESFKTCFLMTGLVRFPGELQWKLLTMFWRIAWPSNHGGFQMLSVVTVVTPCRSVRLAAQLSIPQEQTDWRLGGCTILNDQILFWNRMVDFGESLSENRLFHAISSRTIIMFIPKIQTARRIRRAPWTQEMLIIEGLPRKRKQEKVRGGAKFPHGVTCLRSVGMFGTIAGPTSLGKPAVCVFLFDGNRSI